MVGYHDYVLTVIPVSLLLAIIVGELFHYPTEATLFGGSLIAAAVIGHAMLRMASTMPTAPNTL